MKKLLLLITFFSVGFNSPLFAKSVSYEFYSFVAERHLYPADNPEDVIHRYRAFVKRELKRIGKDGDSGGLFSKSSFLSFYIEEHNLEKSLKELTDCTKVKQLVDHPSFAERQQRARLLWYKESCDAAFESGENDSELFVDYDATTVKILKRFPSGKAFDVYRNQATISSLYPHLDFILNGQEYTDKSFSNWFVSYTDQAYSDYLAGKMDAYEMLLVEDILIDEVKKHIVHLQSCIITRQLSTAPNQNIFAQSDKQKIRASWQHCVDKHGGEKHSKQIAKFPYDLLEGKYGKDITAQLGIIK